MIALRTPLAVVFTMAAVVVGGVAAGCPTQVCTLVGCSSGLTITVADFEPADRFDVVVDADTFAGRFGCVRSAGDFQVVDAEGDFAGDDSDVVATCRGTGVVLRSDELPEAITITVTNGTDTHSGTFADVVYEQQQPNGPDCEPTCNVAGVEVR